MRELTCELRFKFFLWGGMRKRVDVFIEILMGEAEETLWMMHENAIIYFTAFLMPFMLRNRVSGSRFTRCFHHKDANLRSYWNDKRKNAFVIHRNFHITRMHHFQRSIGYFRLH